jgi:AcrR family transcriptional regulator
MKEPTKQGRRAGSPQTREAILAAARTLFASHGYDGTTLRAVAAAAGVDVALSSYYFGSKADLFAAALELPVSPAQALGAVLAQSPSTDDLAERIVRTLLGVWDAASGGPLAALLRSAVSQEEMLKAFIEREIVPLLRSAMDGPDVDLRAACAASQVSGLLLLRYVIGVEPLASAGHDEIVAVLAPALQRYITP